MPDFLYLAWFVCHLTLKKLAETSVVKSRPSVPYGANIHRVSEKNIHSYYWL